MVRKKKEIIVDQETELIAGLLEATERAKLEDLTLKFTPDEYNLPEPVKVRASAAELADATAAGTVKKSKPRYVRGDRFYTYLGQKRVKGKWRGAVEHICVTEEEKTVQVLTKVWDKEKQQVVKEYVDTDVRVRKESRPSKSWLARQAEKEAA